MRGMFTDNNKESVANETFKFAVLDCQATQLLVLSWIRYADVLSNITPQQWTRQLVYILPGTNDQLVCRPAIATLMGFGKRA